LINGKELIFRKPGEESGDESDEVQPHTNTKEQLPQTVPDLVAPQPVAEEAKITIHEDD